MAGVSFAQEVRRAIPVTPSATPKPEPPTAPAVPFDYDNPAWMNRVKPAQPVTTPPPVPQPTATPYIGPEPGFTPYRPQGRVQVMPTPSSPAPPVSEPAQPPPVAPAATPEPVSDESGAIRMSPSAAADSESAEKRQLDLANSLYARKMYDLAIVEYEKFLIASSTVGNRDMAMFRLGECHRMLGNEAAARGAYEKLLAAFRQGEFVGAGSYRLGEYLLADKLWDSALIQFKLAAQQSKNAEVVLTAKYDAARCLEKLQRYDEAAKALAEVAAVKENNPYLDYARLSLAGVQVKLGKKNEALELFDIAGAKGKTPLQAEAAVKGAALAAELGKKEEAAKLFQRVLDNPEAGDWRPAAMIGSLRLAYADGNYKKVAAFPDADLKTLPPDTQAEALLLLADSFRQLGNARAARAVYERLITQFPDSASSGNARFHRLVTLYQVGDPNIVAEADKFLESASDPAERNQVKLLKAEALFKAQKYADAISVYRTLLEADLSKDLQRDALFKLAWCEAQTGDPAGAVKSYSQYIAKYPDSANFAAVLAQRGLALQQAKNYDEAIKDFDRIIKDFPKAKDRELAIQQKALIYGQQQDYKAMTETFKKLISEYPKTAAAAQANFWIGWAAFEAKDYKAAIASLEAARKLDAGQYGERASLRIIMCQYFLQDRDALVKEVAAYKGGNGPAEIMLWVGEKNLEDGNYAAAEQNILPLVKDGNPAKPEIWLGLARAKMKLGKYSEAQQSVEKFLAGARDPSARAQGLLVKAEVLRQMKSYEDASKLVDDALLLQPEGRLNAEARLLSAEIQFSKGDYDTASRTFMTVAVLYDDPGITPRALKRAADAYRKIGNALEADKAEKELQERFPNSEKSGKNPKGQ